VDFQEQIFQARPGVGNSFEFEWTSPQAVPAMPASDSKRVEGKISVRPWTMAQIRTSRKKNAKAWNQGDAKNLPIAVGIRNCYRMATVMRSGDRGGVATSRGSCDLDVAVPEKASLRFETRG